MSNNDPSKNCCSEDDNFEQAKIKHSNRAFYLTKVAINELLLDHVPMTDETWSDISNRILHMTGYVESGHKNGMIRMRDLDWSLVTGQSVTSNQVRKIKNKFQKILRSYKEMLDSDIGDRSMYTAAAD